MADELREFLKIVFGVTLIAILFGTLLAFVSIGVCPEYFSERGRVVIYYSSPTSLAILSGILDWWRYGFCCGVALAIVARLGRPEPVRARSVLSKTALLGCVGLIASVGLLWYLSRNPNNYDPQWDADPRYMAVLISYLVGHGFFVLLDIGLGTVIIVKRFRIGPKSRAGLLDSA
ncbi:MAG: hypothetical protein GC165_02565 [Armatimonadetes bacterium]|nr:hypothetical protein [Armatimonadota bacterium]